MTDGMTRFEAIAAGGLVLLLGTLMLLSVLDAGRRARDAATVSSVRQAQAAIEAYRSETTSYPSEPSDVGPGDSRLLEAFGYSSEPVGCAADKADTCRNYSLSFRLEGPVGTLAGGNCVLRLPEGIRCVKP